MGSFNNDEAQGDVATIDLTKDISVHHQGWYCDYMEEENRISREPSLLPSVQPSVPLVVPSPHGTALISTPIHQPQVHAPAHISKSTRRNKGQTLSQILAIPKFHTSTSRKRTNTLHCHGMLITSIGFLTENKENEDAKNAKDATLEEKRKARAENRIEKENIRVEGGCMVECLNTGPYPFFLESIPFKFSIHKCQTSVIQMATSFIRQ